MTRVSVILPTYNRPEYVTAAIGSVAAQTHRDWELIVADDGSAEATKRVLSELSDPRISILWLSHSGNPSKVRNAAVRQARGEYVAFLDSDDLWDPTKLETQLAALAASPRCRWCYTAVTEIDSSGRPIQIDGRAPWKPLAGNIVEPLITLEALISTSSVLAERSLVEEVGGFDESQRFGEDYDLWLRLAAKSDVAAIDLRLLLERTGHPVSYGRDRIGAYEGWVQLYGKLTQSLSDPRLRALAARRRSESALTLARLYADAKRGGAVWRTLANDARRGTVTAEWWWQAVKTLVRSVAVPSSRP